MPAGFCVTAHTDVCPVAAMENAEKKLYAVQFHPEVTHSEYGNQILRNFLYNVCCCEGTWKMDSFIEDTIRALREKIGDKKVILGLSGGVDSSVAAGCGRSADLRVRGSGPDAQGRGRLRGADLHKAL